MIGAAILFLQKLTCYYFVAEAGMTVIQHFSFMRRKNKYSDEIKFTDYTKEQLKKVNKVLNSDELHELTSQFEKSIKHRYDKIIEYFGPEKADKINAEFKETKIKKTQLIILLGGMGVYYPDKKELNYAFEKYASHEMMHMVSSCALTFNEDGTEPFYRGGFRETTLNSEVGRGLDEGYTEIMRKRVFGDEEKTMQVYRLEERIAGLIELFFDNPKDMENLYIDANLYGLVEKLKEYATDEEVKDILIDMDYINSFSKIATKIPARIKSAQLQLKLYKLFSAKNKDPEKQRKFEEMLDSNPLIGLLRKGKNLSLQKENTYVNDENEFTR